MEIDPTYLRVHPRTALWMEQRELCRRCAHHSSAAGERCVAVRVLGNPASTAKSTLLRRLRTQARCAYCMDARDAGAPCGPDATLFEEKTSRAAAQEQR